MLNIFTRAVNPARLVALTILLMTGGCAIAPKPPEIVKPPVAALQPSNWAALDHWETADMLPSLQAFRQGCQNLGKQASWQKVCALVTGVNENDPDAIRNFFETNFSPYQITNPDGTTTGLITGYYEPLLTGSRTPSERFRYPIYGTPEDMLTIDLTSVYPELKKYRLRGRLEGNRVVPYYSRAEIEDGKPSLKAKPLFWVEDEIDLFFLQIQGSGRIQLEDGQIVRVGYADQNGYPYRSIGRLLVEQKELPLEQAGMQGIKDWAAKNPDKVRALLDSNPSYVFFRELPNQTGGPIGALGVPLTAGYSIAVDPHNIPLGAPVYISTTQPNSDQPLTRLVAAQDTGGAIKGAVRADFFWGFGPEAGKEAGMMRQEGKLWALLPKDFPVQKIQTPINHE